MTAEYGYVYCLSNSSYHTDLLKVGMTMRSPADRVRELYTTGVPTPFKVEFAKKVLNPKQKEKTLHNILSQYHTSYHGREFFRVSLEEVRTFFDLMDGERWVNNSLSFEDEEESSTPTKCRVMSKCFTDGQRIRHTIGINKTWIGIYDSLKNGINHDTKFYKSVSGFAKAHYTIDRPDGAREVNGWSVCECEVNGEWISTYNL